MNKIIHRSRTELPPHVGKGWLHCPLAKHSTSALPWRNFWAFLHVKLSFWPFLSSLPCVRLWMLTLGGTYVILQFSVMEKENQHRQKFIMKKKKILWYQLMLAIRSGWETQRFYEVKVTKLMANINIPEHVGNGAFHCPLSKHVSSLCPSNAKSLVHSNCSLCPDFILLFACGSPATRR